MWIISYIFHTIYFLLLDADFVGNKTTRISLLRNLWLKINTWERGWFSCNVHDSSIYLNIFFRKRVNLTSFQYYMQLLPVFYKQSKSDLYYFFYLFKWFFSHHIFTNVMSMIVEWPCDLIIKTTWIHTVTVQVSSLLRKLSKLSNKIVKLMNHEMPVV